MPLVSQAKPLKPRVANGGTTAPKSAASGPDVRNNKQIPSYWGENLPWGEKSRKFGGGSEVSTKPAATAAPPPQGTPAPRPWDAAYQTAVNNANTKYNNAINSQQLKRGLLWQEYGLDPGWNDYKANPYSRAALLEETYQRAQRASGNSLAAQGQLYSGASQNAETYNREHNAQERNNLEALYRRALQANSDERTAALNQREDEIGAALWKSIEAAGNAELEPETAPGPRPYLNSPGKPRPNSPSASAYATPKRPIPAKAFSRKGK